MSPALRHATRTIRRVAIAVLGGLVLVTGIAMIVLPGPAIVAIPAGLGLLSLEFAWAARWRDAALRRFGKGPRSAVGSAGGGAEGRRRVRSRDQDPSDPPPRSGRW